ncbi:MAG: enoyl-CoA hydratase-related protein [Nocardioidaceae bacterium]
MTDHSARSAGRVTCVRAAGVATITMNRPDAMNGLDTQMKVALRDHILQVAEDPTVRCVVLTGSGRAFCAGQDLKEHVESIGSKPIQEVWSTVSEHFAPMASALATMNKPVVAAVNGVAAGAGASLAFACDFRVVADTAGFNTAFAAIALSCDTGAAWTLPRLVGRARALDLLMQPRTVKADEALSLGLATSVVPADELPAAAAALATRLAAGPTLAYGSIRRAVAFGATHDLASTLEYEGELMALTGASEDHRNAVAAFVAKEKPTFLGR